MMRIGVDLGGTKIEVIALDDHGRTLLRRRIPTPTGDYTGTVDAIACLVFDVEKEIGEAGTVGLATPGALSLQTGLIKNSNSVVLNGKPLDRDITTRLGRAVRLENDANCFALSEAVDGAAAGSDVVFGVILGTGVGGGIIVNKQPLTGHNKIAGEWGHNPLPWANETELGRRCYCGKSNCIETFLSGAGLAREYRDRTGSDGTAQEIVSAANVGNGTARECLKIYQDRLARSLAMVINIVDPDTIVLGGGLSNIPDLYIGLSALVATYAFSDAIDNRIVAAAHGDSSGVRGAAWLWPNGRKP